MRITKSVLPLALSMSLFVLPAFAEDLSMPDKEHRQGMSYEEYSNFRAKMRDQMEKAHQEELKQANKPDSARPEKSEESEQKNTYGKGYHMRDRDEARPDTTPDSRPERPRAERFNRGDMMRR